MIELSLDLHCLRLAYADGASPEEVVRLVYSRIKAAADPGIFISLLDEETALAHARALGPYDADKPLWGAPFAIKDNIDLAGTPTTAACPDFAFTPKEDAFCVARLVAAGAIPIGKTNLDQFATGLVGVRSPYPVPLNSFNARVVPGGSSSGSAVAVARGLVSFALGTDTAGSGRVPAGLNNIVGLKPTLGAISTRGIVPACRTLDCVSIFALTVDDAYAVFAEMAAFDPQDGYSRQVPVTPLGPAQPALRLGIPDARTLTFAGDDQARAAFDHAKKEAIAAGAQILELDFQPFFDVARLLYEGPWVAERYQAIRGFIDSKPDSVYPVTHAIIEGAKRFTAADAFEALYKLADLRQAASSVWSSVDAMMVPTYPRPRSVADLSADPLGPNSELGTYTNFVNLMDMCALAVPTALRADGFPNSVTLIAPSGRDGLLAAFGAALHAHAGVSLGATGREAPQTTMRSRRAQAGEIEVAVVGAHLSGMALNNELTSRGGRFLRACPTTPEYRLFALPGGPPRRPGLLRVASGGAAIATEVWAMPEATFGSFVAGVPAPLGIGTTRLCDGTHPKGFIVENVATNGAEDITTWGGWRAYCAGVAA
ncbi:MAG: allophanate hydrolase [Beijerinckiaceae bacterium]|nr:allophanate hydrolase [Beijerinckiaceae bacterium]